MNATDIQSRKNAFQRRLEEFGLPLISDLEDDYFFIDHLRTASAMDTGRRMLALLSLAFLAQSAEAAEDLEAWLIQEHLWEVLSQEEKDFVRVDFAIEEKQQEFSWRIEGAYMLAWALNLVLSPSPAIDISDSDMDEMNEQIVEIGGETKPFLSRLSLRPIVEIRDEALFYSAVASYNNEVFILGGKTQANVHPIAAFERDKALDWIFKD